MKIASDRLDVEIMMNCRRVRDRAWA